jgi:hypothetical protein
VIDPLPPSGLGGGGDSWRRGAREEGGDAPQRGCCQAVTVVAELGFVGCRGGGGYRRQMVVQRGGRRATVGAACQEGDTRRSNGGGRLKRPAVACSA